MMRLSILEFDGYKVFIGHVIPPIGSNPCLFANMPGPFKLSASAHTSICDIVFTVTQSISESD